METGTMGATTGRSIERHVVLVAPEMPGNTGSTGRTCLGAGAVLHLVHPLGFSLEEKQVRRAGLDYWPRVDLRVWADFSAFLAALHPADDELVLLTRRAPRLFWQMPAGRRLFLIFGSESRGLPDELLGAWPECTYRIPVTQQIRSLNLSTAVGIVLFESLRVCGGPVGSR